MTIDSVTSVVACLMEGTRPQAAAVCSSSRGPGWREPVVLSFERTNLTGGPASLLCIPALILMVRPGIEREVVAECTRGSLALRDGRSL